MTRIRIRIADGFGYNFSPKKVGNHPIMKSPPTFEINVAVIGPVSAGKSTLLNALLVGKYSEVSIQRTTAGVNFFRLNHHKLTVASPEEDNLHNDQGSSRTTARNMQASEDDTKWGMIPDRLKSEDKVLQSITKDNQALRDNDSSEVSEKIFDVYLDKPLCECRSDTKLVIVEVPGINEADSNRKFRDYIANNWTTYDCVILVMDSRQVVNTEEQVDALEFVKKTMESKKIPVVILFNKIDDIDRLQVDSAIQEARRKVTSLFGVPDKLDLVEEIVAGDLSFENWDKSTPLFLPVSARNGYMYRLARAVHKERFKLLEQDLVEALGQEEIGRAAWRRVSEEKKYDAAYEAISEREVYEEGIKRSNFQKFLSILEFCVGGSHTQALLIEQQLRVGIQTFAGEEDLALEVSRLHDIIKVYLDLQLSDRNIWEELKRMFWLQYGAVEEKCCRESCRSPQSSHKAIEELVKYYEFACQAGWDVEQSLAIDSATCYLNKFVEKVLNSLSPAVVGSYYVENSTEVLLEVARDTMKLSQLLDAMRMARCGHDPFQKVRLVVEVVRQKAIAILAYCKRDKECDLCGETLPDYVSCHYQKDGRCTVIFNTTCPQLNCTAAGNHHLQESTSTSYHCRFCDQTWYRCSSTELGGNFNYGNVDWVNRLHHQASDPSHFGHGLWLFFEFMDPAVSKVRW